MTVMVCLDNGGGMMFNNRRQSRDKSVIKDIAAVASGGKLFAAPYSSRLFLPEIEAEVSEDFLDRAGDGDFCFVEDKRIMPYLEKIHRLIIYRWNRDYPSDFKLDIEPDKCGFNIIESSEFPGSSHERITKEVFEK